MERTEIVFYVWIVAAERADPDGRNSDLAKKKPEKLCSVLERDVDVLNNRFGCTGIGQNALREPHNFLVCPRIQCPFRSQKSYKGPLHVEVFGTPKPVGIPAPYIRHGCKPVLFITLN